MGKKVYSRWTSNTSAYNRKDLFHNHNYYNRECKICRQYVNELFYSYFDDIYRLKTIKKKSGNCGQTCLKYTIIFYCVITIILSICVICYSSKLFGLMTDKMADSLPRFNNPRLEIYSIMSSSVVMLIFFIGLIGCIVESLMCLRIFGAIIGYLFLLTFSSFLYIIILMIISNSALKLIASVVSSAAAVIVIHASMAIAPFVFADLIYKEREESETYVKYPSLRSHGCPYQTYGYPESMRSPVAKTSSQVRFQDDWL